jgi:hypothetical protein
VIEALTGHLPSILIAAAVLTWPISWGLLALYRRAVRRSMAARASGSTTSRAGRAAVPATAESASVVPLDVSAAVAETKDCRILLRDLLMRPWRTARVYAVAALAYAMVLTAITTPFADPGGPFRPLRFLLLTTMFAWPLVPTLAIVAGTTRQRKLAIGGAYAVVYVALVVVASLASPEFSVQDGLLLWTIRNGPGIALLALCLNRRIRAVGPLVLLFLILGLLGADALLAVFGSNDVLLRGAVTIAGSLGLGGIGTFLGMILAGFAALAVVGALLLSVIRRRYEHKRLSDESLTTDTVWWVYVFGHAIGLAFEHPAAPLGGVAAMIAFKAVTRIGFALAPATQGAGRKLLLLRSFSIGSAAEHLFDAIEKHWRRVGSIQMIAGDDLATRTIEPHEFLDFLTGKLARRFIDGPPALEQRLHEMDDRPDRDGRFRVNDFFCYDDTWRAVLSSLVNQTDAVLMDLRGFSVRNGGCVFEIGELFRLVPLERVLFVIDRDTDMSFLDQTFGRAATMAISGSMVGVTQPLRPRVFACTSLDARTFVGLLHALAATAHPEVSAISCA